MNHVKIDSKYTWVCVEIAKDKLCAYRRLESREDGAIE